MGKRLRRNGNGGDTIQLVLSGVVLVMNNTDFGSFFDVHVGKDINRAIQKECCRKHSCLMQVGTSIFKISAYV